MIGEVRVTVVATGFGKAASAQGVKAGNGRTSSPSGTPVIPIDGARRGPVVIGGAYTGGAAAPGVAGGALGALGALGSSHPTAQGGAVPARRPSPMPASRPSADLDDLEIPTFIRRQMD